MPKHMHNRRKYAFYAEPGSDSIDRNFVDLIYLIYARLML